MKLFLFIIIIIGVMMLSNLAGINTTTGYVLTNLGILNHPENLQSTTLYTVILALFVSVLVGGIVIGYFTKSSPEVYLLAPLAGLFVLFVGDIISIINYVNATGTDWIKWIVVLILSPLSVGYLISVVDWWRGSD
jgi:putative effector of murein hydrolase LrgA (UPF0299 family)